MVPIKGLPPAQTSPPKRQQQPSSRPKPTTQWYIDSIRAPSSEGVLRMERLRRQSLHANVTCSASNTVLAPPVYSNFTVNLYCK
ncbi:hypothetical protein M8J77_019505 [Diaphorina citri]|nr:hypothetical protein M8J77_019505 [Diaphorina citri]